MPVTESTSFTGIESWLRWLWIWVPLIAMLIVPLTGQSLSLSLEKDHWARDFGLFSLGFLALTLLIPLEDIFGIEGSGSTIARAFRQPDAVIRASSIWMLTATGMYLAVVIVIPTRFWPQGLSSTPASIRFLMGLGLKFSAWVILGRFVLQCLFGDYRHTVGSVEMFEAFEHPSSILGLGAANMLCALPFWVLGHFIQPRKKLRSKPIQY